jgi:hypothetical protein
VTGGIISVLGGGTIIAGGCVADVLGLAIGVLLPPAPAVALGAVATPCAGCIDADAGMAVLGGAFGPDSLPHADASSNAAKPRIALDHLLSSSRIRRLLLMRRAHPCSTPPSRR